MDFKYYAEKLWYKVIYLAGVIIYLIRLNQLNHELLIQNFETPFMLLAYNNYVALQYFVAGVIFFAIGCILLHQEGKRLTRGLEDFREIMIAIVTIIVVLLLIVLIFLFIDNPILRAVMFAVLVIFGVVGTATN